MAAYRGDLRYICLNCWFDLIEHAPGLTTMSKLSIKCDVCEKSSSPVVYVDADYLEEVLAKA